MTAIRRGTARRLGIRPALAGRVLQLADAVGIRLDPWQRVMVRAAYRHRADVSLAEHLRRARPAERRAVTDAELVARQAHAAYRQRTTPPAARTPWEDLRGAADILGRTWPPGAMEAALRESDPHRQ